jgi:glycosyltransferase involved in cell wall biosynthesis
MRQAVWQDLRLPADSATSDQHLDEAILWLCRAQDAVNGGGVSYGYDLKEGWLRPYPETTGYIIPTFLNYARNHKSEIGEDRARSIRERVERMALWLTTVQMQSGAIPGGTAGLEPKPTVFNTGQVLQGWCRAYREFHDETILQSLVRAARWLVSMQDDDGCWRKAMSPLTVQTPATYNVRTASALLEAADTLDEPAFRNAAVKNFDWALEQQRATGWFENNCVRDIDQPLTHTIGYTLEGLLDGAVALGSERYLSAVDRASRPLRNAVRGDGFLSGRFDAEWRPRASWNCLTGACQIALVWFRLGRILKDEEYLSAAARLLSFVKRTQRLLPASTHRDSEQLYPDGVRGGIKGSHPSWGDYDPFRYLCWGAKFFADAILIEEATEHESTNIGVSSHLSSMGSGRHYVSEQQTAAGLKLGYVVECFATFVVNEIRELRKLGAAVTVLNAFRPVPEKDPLIESLRQESLYFPPAYREVLSANLRCMIRKPITFVKMALLLRRERESLRMLLLAAYYAREVSRKGITHLHGTFGTRTTTLAFVTAQLAGVDYSFTTHAYDIFNPNPSLVWKTNHARFMRTISEFNKRYIEANYKGVDSSKIVVAYLGVDVEKFTALSNGNRSGSKPRVVSVGDLIPKKGHNYLIGACEILLKRGLAFQCDIIGEGPLHASLQHEIERRGLADSVRLLGKQDHEFVRRSLIDANVFVLACIDARYLGEHLDGIPVSLMEAMAMSLPVVSTPVSGIPELIENDVSGFLVPEKDRYALANALEKLIQQESLRMSVGRCARLRIEKRFDHTTNTEEFARMFAGNQRTQL